MPKNESPPLAPIDLHSPRGAEQVRAAVEAGELEEVTLGLGCFWKPDSRFGSMDGVVQTRVGYAGGTLNNPSYRNMPGHAEVTRVVFDPSKISFEVLFKDFRDWLTPAKAFGSKYRPVIFARSDEHTRLVRAWVLRIEDESVRPQIADPSDAEALFWDAEPYHQKYRLKKANPDLATALAERLGPRWEEHELTTKLNGFEKEELSDSRHPLIRQLLGSPKERLAAQIDEADRRSGSIDEV